MKEISFEAGKAITEAKIKIITTAKILEKTDIPDKEIFKIMWNLCFIELRHLEDYRGELLLNGK